MKPKPIYAIYPGFVRSATDGDVHHISVEHLCRLYSVRIKDCMVVRADYLTRPDMRGFIDAASKLPRLFPRQDGNYQLPAEKGST